MIVVAGLILAFILILIFSNRRTRACRWREDRRGDRDGQRKYRCMACGAEAFTSNGKPPLDCLAHQRPRQ
ncbi:hypothetical protein FDP25_06925 [Roseovarius sp. A21]|uniref:Uncharacterized protein n=1 Tax=Roseovarius bejariae TaxID=2576383 RepID=A0A844CWY8_9RHOB|nr:hypothetical protein [Roseovarius bejariae]MRU15160.1 hypothetical protein [Roseovarius bejariae]